MFCMNEIIDKTLKAMEEQLKKTILEKKEMAKSLTEAEYRLSELTKQVSDDKVAHKEFREAIEEQLSTKERIKTKLLREREKLTNSFATLVRERDILVMQLEEMLMQSLIIPRIRLVWKLSNSTILFGPKRHAYLSHSSMVIVYKGILKLCKNLLMIP